MQHVTDDVLADVVFWLVPDELQAAGAEGRGLQTARRLGQLSALAEGQAGAGLVGAGAVFSDALVDGLVHRGDTCDGQCPAGGDRENRETSAYRVMPP